MARDVAALIDHLDLDAVDVLGFSMGAVTAAKLLTLGPNQVKSAILAGVGDEGEGLDGWTAKPIAFKSGYKGRGLGRLTPALFARLRSREHCRSEAGE